jgi:Family of unknown function (DUF5302)
MNRDEEVDPEGRPADDDETHRRFREALERKRASGGAHLGPHAEGGAHLKGSNTKHRREFRRKSG